MAEIAEIFFIVFLGVLCVLCGKAPSWFWLDQVRR